MKATDWKSFSKNKKVIDLLKERERIEQEINKLDKKALLKYLLHELHKQ